MWTDADSSDLEVFAKEAWKELIVKADLPANGWTFARLSKRDDPQIARISYLAEHIDRGRFTFKFQFRPLAQAGFASHFHMQAKAFDAFAHSGQLTLPQPVFLDADNQASLMTFVAGDPVSIHMREATDDRSKQLDLLTRAGRWLDAYHRAGFQETRIFQPKYTVRHYAGIRDQIVADQVSVAEKALFLRGIDNLIAVAPRYESQTTTSAVQHGDFHMRNLIFDGQRMAGIDISKNEAGPVGYDIAKILLDYTAIMRSVRDLSPGQIIPQNALDAFFTGYTLVNQDDPSVGLLLYARILATLIHVPADEDARTDTIQRTLTRLRPIAENAFQLL